MRRASLALALWAYSCVAWSSEFQDDVARYAVEVEQTASQETDDGASQYLRECLAALGPLRRAEQGEADLSKVLRGFIAARIRAQAAPGDPATLRRPGPRAEQRAYDDYLFRYSKEEYLVALALQRELLERKYFKTQTAPNSNFVEGLLNGAWDLTRTDQSEAALHRPDLGVSSWEAIARFEPAAIVHESANIAIVGTLGLSNTLFPRVLGSGADRTLEETFASSWVRKWGVRLGAGAIRVDGDTRFVTGPGVQVNALAIWALYQPYDDSVRLAVGVSNLAKLQKAIGWF